MKIKLFVLTAVLALPGFGAPLCAESITLLGKTFQCKTTQDGQTSCTLPKTDPASAGLTLSQEFLDGADPLQIIQGMKNRLKNSNSSWYNHETFTCKDSTRSILRTFAYDAASGAPFFQSITLVTPDVKLAVMNLPWKTKLEFKTLWPDVFSELCALEI